MDLETLVGLIGDGNAKRGEAAAMVGAAKASADQVSQQLSGMGITDRAGEVAEIAHGLAEVHATLTGLADRLQELPAAAQQAAGGLLTGGSRAPGPAPPPPAPPKPFHPRRRNRAHEDDIRGLGRPKNTVGRTSARGRRYGTDGKRLVDAPWRADPEVRHDDLREPWASADDHVSRWHVEGQVAAWMRKTGTTEAVLYQNLPPCGRSTRDPGRCDMSIAPMLPEGSSLVVWTVPENGTPYSVRYQGGIEVNDEFDRLDEDLDTHTVAALAIERGCRPPGWAPGDPVPGIATVYPDDGDDPVLAWHTDKLGGGDQETLDDIQAGR